MKGRKPVDIDESTLRRLHLQGLDGTEIAKYFNVSLSTLYNRAKDIGLRFSRYGRFAARCDTLPILKMYRDWHWGLKTIETMFGFPHPSRQLLRYLKEKGCHIRSNHEQWDIEKAKETERLRDCKQFEIAYYIKGKRQVLNKKGEFENV